MENSRFSTGKVVTKQIATRRTPRTLLMLLGFTLVFHDSCHKVVVGLFRGHHTPDELSEN